MRKDFPSSGTAWNHIREELVAAKADDFDWKSGRLPVYSYYRDEELLAVANEAYMLYMGENALGGRNAFPSVARLEREVVEMGLSLLGGDERSGGTFCSGGTESIFMALKTCRDKARATRPEVKRPNFIAPGSGHATICKAGAFLDIDVIRIPVGDDLRADVKAMRAAVDDQTIGIAGSAPCYPYGVIDPIAELGELALEHGLWLHVDACVGGFLAPFARRLGYPIPPFELSVPGVSSLSADLHKYGYTAKGASLSLFKDAEDQRRYQLFECSWPRGIYATYAFQGTRPAGAVASAWAVMNYLGIEGYTENARIIMETKERLMAGIEAIRGLRVLRPSDLCILLYYSEDEALDINAVGDEMRARGWFVGICLEPVAIALALNTAQAGTVDDYIRDLSASVEAARHSRAKGEAALDTY